MKEFFLTPGCAKLISAASTKGQQVGYLLRQERDRCVEKGSVSAPMIAFINQK
jgi:hypothetical protein